MSISKLFHFPAIFMKFLQIFDHIFDRRRYPPDTVILRISTLANNVTNISSSFRQPSDDFRQLFHFYSLISSILLVLFSFYSAFKHRLPPPISSTTHSTLVLLASSFAPIRLPPVFIQKYSTHSYLPYFRPFSQISPIWHTSSIGFDIDHWTYLYHDHQHPISNLADSFRHLPDSHRQHFTFYLTNFLYFLCFIFIYSHFRLRLQSPISPTIRSIPTFSPSPFAPIAIDNCLINSAINSTFTITFYHCFASILLFLLKTDRFHLPTSMQSFYPHFRLYYY